MQSFLYPPEHILKTLTFPTLKTKYIYSRTSLVGKLFWTRLIQSVNIINEKNISGTALEIGCGSGLILPSLSRLMQSVVGIDLNIDDAHVMVRSLGLNNVELIQGNVLELKRPASFDVVILNDVLEHISDIGAFVARIKKLMKPGAYIIISAPTENVLYVISRLLFNVKKPTDHFHSANAVISVIADHFNSVEVHYIPFKRIPVLSYFALINACN